MWLLLLSTLALAETPEFIAEPSVASIATTAWEAATECAGWEAEAHDVVRIVKTGPDPDGWAGHAHKDHRGMYQISLHDRGADEVVDTLVHEVCHAWPSSYDRPKALTEGLTDLLAACVRRKRPGLGMRPIDEGIPYTPQDLAYWTNSDTASPLERNAGYVASYRLVAAASKIVGEQALWPKDRTHDVGWPWFWGLLATEPFSDDHRRVLAAMGPHGGELDVDGDGLTVGQEEALGTDPWSWDSDGDGWWDGAEPASNTVPLPLTGSPVCFGLADESSDVELTISLGGKMSGEVELWARTFSQELWLDHENRIRLPRGEVLYLSVTSTSPVMSAGGVWVSLSRRLRPVPECPIPRQVSSLPNLDLTHMPWDIERSPPIPPEWRYLVDDALVAGRECLDRAPTHPVVIQRRGASERRVLEGVARSWVVSDNSPVGDALVGAVADCIAGRIGMYEVRQPVHIGTTIRPAKLPVAWVRALNRRVPLSTLVSDDGLLDPVVSIRRRLLGVDPTVDALLAFWDNANSGTEDADSDGVPAFVEAALGLSDNSSDTVSGGLPDSLDGFVLPGAVPTLIDAGWNCSGQYVETKFGKATFEAVDLVGRMKVELEVWNDQGRVVRGLARPMLIWSVDGARDPDCAEGARTIWLRRSDEVGSDLVNALETVDLGGPGPRRLVVLGGTGTRVGKEALFLSDKDLQWARSNRRPDVMVALLRVLGEYLDLGVQPRQVDVNDELALAIGYGVYNVQLSDD